MRVLGDAGVVVDANMVVGAREIRGEIERDP